jgi:hypothetical protein
LHLGAAAIACEGGVLLAHIAVPGVQFAGGRNVDPMI